jgi:trigger factor
MPPLTDAWASEVSEFQTLLELRAEIRGKLEAGKTYSADQRFRSLAVQAAADNATLDLPDVVVREQAEEMLSDFKQSLEAQGGDFNSYVQVTGTSVEQMIADLKPSAASNVKTGLVLDAVAKAEGLEATDEEVSAVIAQMAASGRVDAQDLEKGLRRTGRIQAIKWQIVRDKAADFIAANAIALSPGAAAVAEAKEALAAVPPADAAAEGDATTAADTAADAEAPAAETPRATASEGDSPETEPAEPIDAAKE